MTHLLKITNFQRKIWSFTIINAHRNVYLKDTMNKEFYKKYNIGFTSGALLFKEAQSAIPLIQNEIDFMSGHEDLDQTLLPINSENSKKRIKFELEKRLRAIQNPVFLELYKSSDDQNKKLILFYAANKLYGMITEFMLETVLIKWLNLDDQLTTDDFQNFIYKKMDSHPELLEITENTRYKLAQVTLKMLKELGILHNHHLSKIHFNENILKAIVDNCDQWFLNVLLLNDQEKNEILS